MSALPEIARASHTRILDGLGGDVHPFGMGFRLSERVFSFRHAIRGILFVVRTQPNAWIHLVATVAVICAGACLSLAHWEWAALVFAIGLVWTAEALNTAIEFLADEVTREQREGIGRAKDCGAAGVLLAAMAAAIIGLIVFVPHLLALADYRS